MFSARANVHEKINSDVVNVRSPGSIPFRTYHCTIIVGNEAHLCNRVRGHEVYLCIDFLCSISGPRKASAKTEIIRPSLC
jgi:hypothetical protein